MKKRKQLLCLCLLFSICAIFGCGAQTNTQPQSVATEALPEGNYFIDLHLHADGALSVDTAIALAETQGDTLPTQNRDELFSMLSAPVNCADLNEYLERFDLPCSLMQTEETVAEAFYRIQEELKEKGVMYAELRFAPQLHLERGMTQEEVVNAAIAGLNRSDFNANLILCCMRGDDNKEQNLETVRLAAKYKDQGVVAVDLAGAEALFPTEDFEDVFAYAKEAGLTYTIHAGEAADAESVTTALSFGASRIGHGVHASESAAVMSELHDKNVPLELCITSNLQTKAVDKLENYPLRTFMNNDVPITLNTDNPTVSNTTIKAEWELAKTTFGLTNEEVKEILLASAAHSFADEETKDALKAEIEKAFS